MRINRQSRWGVSAKSPGGAPKDGVPVVHLGRPSGPTLTAGTDRSIPILPGCTASARLSHKDSRRSLVEVDAQQSICRCSLPRRQSLTARHTWSMAAATRRAGKEALPATCFGFEGSLRGWLLGDADVELGMIRG